MSRTSTSWLILKDTVYEWAKKAAMEQGVEGNGLELLPSRQKAVTEVEKVLGKP